VGLCYGGRVLATGQNQWGQCATDKWCNVVSVSCGRTFTAALLADGRVLTAGQHMRGQSQKPGNEDVGQAVMSWEKAETTGYEPFRTEWMSDVMGLTCGQEHLMAVDRYGQVLAEGLDLDGQCTVASTFLLFRDIRQLDGFGIYAVTDQAATREHTAETASKKDSIRLPAVTAGLRTTLMLSRSTARNLAGLVGQGLIHRAYLTKEGQFFNSGSGGAMYHGTALYDFPENADSLQCAECYFTHERNDDVEDIAVYYNTTGSWDVNESEETDMLVDDLFAKEEEIIKEAIYLELTSFAEYAGVETNDSDALDAVREK